MKHIKFDVEQPIIALQRIPNMIFVSSRRELAVINDFFADGIIRLLKKEGIECKKLSRSVYNHIRLGGDYHFTHSGLDPMEIIVVKGNNLIYICDEFGNVMDCDDMAIDNTIGQTKEDLC